MVCCFSTILNQTHVLNDLQVIKFSFYWHFTHWPSFWGNTIVLLFLYFFVWFWVTKFVFYLSSLSILHPCYYSQFFTLFTAQRPHSDLSFQITECERNALQKQPCLFLLWRCKENVHERSKDLKKCISWEVRERCLVQVSKRHFFSDKDLVVSLSFSISTSYIPYLLQNISII